MRDRQGREDDADAVAEADHRSGLTLSSRLEISGIAPFFIVRNVPEALAFYRDRLGFDITFQGPADDIFLALSSGAPR